MKVAVDKNKKGDNLSAQEKLYIPWCEVSWPWLCWWHRSLWRIWCWDGKYNWSHPCNHRETWSQDELQKDRDHVHRESQRFQPHRSSWKRRSHQGSGPLQIPWSFLQCWWDQCQRVEQQNWENISSFQRVGQGVVRSKHQSGHQHEILQRLRPFHTSICMRVLNTHWKRWSQNWCLWYKRRLQWFGHIQRMDMDRIPNKLYL